MKTLGIVFVAMWTGLQAQELPKPFAAIIRALSLTELQVSQLQQSFPTADARKLAILNGTQIELGLLPRPLISEPACH